MFMMSRSEKRKMHRISRVYFKNWLSILILPGFHLPTRKKIKNTGGLRNLILEFIYEVRAICFGNSPGHISKVKEIAIKGLGRSPGYYFRNVLLKLRDSIKYSVTKLKEIFLCVIL
jgi:hypothetical protein